MNSTYPCKPDFLWNGLPLNNRVTRVHANVTRPDGLEQVTWFTRQGAGWYESDFNTREPGIYKFHIIAEGRSRNGDRFRREQLLTGAVWNPLPAREGRSRPTPIT